LTSSTLIYVYDLPLYIYSGRRTPGTKAKQIDRLYVIVNGRIVGVDLGRVGSQTV
jgi:hypothetical protein